jgi:hypothetical protein
MIETLTVLTTLVLGLFAGSLLTEALAGALDGTEVDKHVLAAFRGDEAKALGVVEPLHGSSLTIRHISNPCCNKMMGNPVRPAWPVSVVGRTYSLIERKANAVQSGVLKTALPRARAPRMSAFATERVLSVRHWNNDYFSFTTTRDDGLRFENGQFVMIGRFAPPIFIDFAFSMFLDC